MDIRSKLFQTFKWALGLHCLFFPLNILGYLESGEDTAEQQQRVISGLPQAFLLGLIVLVLWLWATDALEALLRRRLHLETGRMKMFQSALVYFVMLFITLALVSVPVNTFTSWLMQFVDGSDPVFIFISFNQVILIAFLMVTRRAMENAQEIKIRTEKLQKDKIRSQFDALKSQVNPHFLFNSLSTLTSLVHVDPDLSEKFIEQLSKAYRYILEQRDKELVPLATELDFIRAYLFLLEVRYKGKLDVRIDIPEIPRQQCQLPPLALQMLLEHTINHNRMSAKEPLRIDISTHGEQYLEIRNTRRPRQQAEWADEDKLHELTRRYALVTVAPLDVQETEAETLVRVPLVCAATQQTID